VQLIEYCVTCRCTSVDAERVGSCMVLIKQQQQTEHAKPAGGRPPHKKLTASPSLAAVFYRAFRCASPRSTHVGPRTHAPVRQCC
jgi:hypothetical protein